MIRVLGSDEKNIIRPLYEEVFNDSETFLDYYFGSYIKDTINFVYQSDDKIVGMATIHPKTLVISDKKVSVGYVYAVATKEEYRKQGIMRKILNEIYAYALEANYDYLYLIPENSKVYESLGYKLLRQGSLQCYEKKALEQKDLTVNKVRKMDKKDIQECIDFLSNFYRNNVMYLYTKELILENLNRLSINRSGIYCVLDDVCDRILGMAFIEDDEKVNFISLICEESHGEMCVLSIMEYMNVENTQYKIHDIMFKEVHSGIEGLADYSILINDEI